MDISDQNPKSSKYTMLLDEYGDEGDHGKQIAANMHALVDQQH